MRKLFLFIIILCTINSFSQDTIKVMTANLLNYNNNTSYCTQTNNSVTNKDAYIRDIFSYVMPDIWGVNEVSGNGSTSAQRILDNDLNISGATWYKRANYQNSNGSDIISMIYYDSRKFTLYNQNYLTTSYRDIMIYKFYYNSPDITTLNDTVFLTCIQMHLKAGSTASDLSDRAAETLQLMSYLNGLSNYGNVIVMGDFNVQSSNEQSFQNLINYSNSNIRFYDPPNKLGDWKDNSAFTMYHTQSTNSISNGCNASGGMDDRFDFILASFYVMNNIAKIKYVPGSYIVIGQDGAHMNQSINSPANYSVPSSVLNALYNNSDHLPVTIKLRINQTPISGVNKTPYISHNIKLQNIENNNAQIEIYSDKNNSYNISLYNQLGEIIYKSSFEILQGYNYFSIPFKQCTEGLYLLNINCPTENSTFKIMKVNK